MESFERGGRGKEGTGKGGRGKKEKEGFKEGLIDAVRWNGWILVD